MALASQPIPISSAEHFKTRRNLGMGQLLLTPGRYWHLLSLDAPSVAALWAWSFARAVHVALSADSLLLLFLGTWLLYVVDRILDGLRQNHDRLRERHFFYMRHRTAALIVVVPVSALLAWLVFARMLPDARRADILVAAVATGYFLLVHLHGAKIESWFPKELIVALVFAAGTAVPAWARLGGLSRICGLAVLAALFAALCWVNCIAIEKWELRDSGPLLGWPVADGTARWGQRRLRALCIATAALALVSAAAFLYIGQLTGAGVLFAAALSSALFFRLDRSALSAFTLRVTADAVLLTPLLLLFLR